MTEPSSEKNDNKASDGYYNLTAVFVLGFVGLGVIGNIRIIPAAFDLAMVSTVMASVKRVGNFEIMMDKIQPQLLRWILFQLLFIGDGILDILIFVCKKYPDIFRSRILVDPQEIPPSFLSYAMSYAPNIPEKIANLHRASVPSPGNKSSALKSVLGYEFRKRSSTEIPR